MRPLPVIEQNLATDLGKKILVTKDKTLLQYLENRTSFCLISQVQI